MLVNPRNIAGAFALVAGTVSLAGCSAPETAKSPTTSAVPAAAGAATKPGTTAPLTTGEAQQYQEKMKAEPTRVPNAR